MFQQESSLSGISNVDALDKNTLNHRAGYRERIQNDFRKKLEMNIWDSCANIHKRKKSLNR